MRDRLVDGKNHNTALFIQKGTRFFSVFIGSSAQPAADRCGLRQTSSMPVQLEPSLFYLYHAHVEVTATFMKTGFPLLL